MDSHVERRAKVQGAPDEQAGFGGLCGVESVLGAVVATTAIGRVRTKTGIAQFLAPERPVDEIAQGWLLRPLPS